MGQVIYRTSREVKRAWWAKALIQSKQERYQTGMTVAEWCEHYNVSEKSYWYYHKLLGDELAQLVSEQEKAEPLVPMTVRNTCDNTPVFTELTAPKAEITCEKKSTSAVICKSDIRIEVSDSVTDEFLLRIIRAVSHA